MRTVDHVLEVPVDHARPDGPTLSLCAREVVEPGGEQRLYDEEALRAADVPVAAAVYYDDAFVDRDMSLRTASLLQRVHPWITNEYEHTALRTSGEKVIDRLITIVRDL